MFVVPLQTSASIPRPPTSSIHWSMAVISIADFVLPASSNAAYFDLIEALQDTIAAEFATISIVAYNDTADEVRLTHLTA